MQKELEQTTNADQQARPNSSLVVSIVLSFFNEEENIPELVYRLQKTFRGLIQTGAVKKYELIFIDDCSTVHSFQLLVELSKKSCKEEKIRILRMSRNFGVSACVFAGFQHAQGDVSIYMDSDLQDPPEVIPQMIDVILSQPGIEVVHTIRTKRAGESFIKLLITKCGYYFLKKSSSIDLPIEAGDFKLLSKRAVQELLRFGEVNPYIRGIVSWVGFSQARIYYNRERRFSGKTKFPIFSSRVISNFISSALIAFSDLPLTIVSLVGIFISIISFCLGTYLGGQYIVSGSARPEMLTVVAFSFLAGIQLIGIGVLGLYIGPILKGVRNRPRYVISSTYGFAANDLN